MAEVINTNVFDAEKKFVDFAGLDYFWEKAKAYVDGADKVTADKVAALEGVVGDSTKGLVQKVNLIQGELDGLNGGAGSITTQIENAIAALDLANTYEAKGAADAALEAAKEYADGLDGLMDARVAELEAIDHEKLAADASAAAVATILDDAPESFDTLKEVAAWIANNDHASDVATLMTDVAALKAIDHDAYKAADTALEASLKGYADQVFMGAKTYAENLTGIYDAKGSAATAESNAKAYADGKFQVAGDYEAAGTAAAAIAALDLPNAYDAKGAAATAKSEAIAKAAEDAAAMLASYYTKDEVDGLVDALNGNIETAQGAAEAYAKTYTDALFTSFAFAQNSDIDGLFAVAAE